MKVIKKLMTKSGTYKDRQTGKEKNSYHKCGVLMENSDGELCIKIESLPVFFEGWINCWDLESRSIQDSLSEGSDIDSSLENKLIDNSSSLDDDIPF